MENSRTSLDPRTLVKLSGLTLKARTIVEGVLSGLHRSPSRGFSVEFAEHRDYTPGDDLRYLDWKAWAKTDRHYLKQYEAETNFAAYLLLDVSESMEYRSNPEMASKREYATWLAAAFAHLVLRQRDAIGLATFDTQLRSYLRPASSPAHLAPLLNELEQSEPGGETTLGPLMHEIAERLTKRGVVILLSDFFDDPEQILFGLRHFRHRRHDVRLVQIIDPAEQDFPFEDLTLFRGLEQLPEQLADPKHLADAYRAEFEADRQRLERGSRELGMSYHLIRTDQPVDEAMRGLLLDR